MRNLSRAEHLAAWLCGMGILLGCGGVWALRHVPLTAEEGTEASHPIGK